VLFESGVGRGGGDDLVVPGSISITLTLLPHTQTVRISARTQTVLTEGFGIVLVMTSRAFSSTYFSVRYSES
jgi:hypothetical protein